ncbi:DUF3231 family protein [Bacillus timonensis]|nr:DUF3231 family protein [Bacillus timonensis]
MIENHSPKLTSSEIASIWGTYIENTMSLNIYTYMINCVQDREICELLNEDKQKLINNIEELTKIFLQENLPVPVGFNENDLHEQAKPLLSDSFFLLFVKMMAKAGMTRYATTLSMNAREDLRNFFSHCQKQSTESFNKACDISLQKGVFVRAPFIATPKENKFVADTDYLDGFKVIGNIRPLNVVEISHLYLNNEFNLIGLLLCTAFSQVCKEKEIAEHMIKGKELSKKITKNLTEFLIKSEVQAPNTWDAMVTDSKEAPFSDKLMLYLMNMLTAFGIGDYAISSAASLRSDLQGEYANILSDVTTFAKQGMKLMIKYGWLEEPPSAPDRNNLSQH